MMTTALLSLILVALLLVCWLLIKIHLVLEDSYDISRRKLGELEDQTDSNRIIEEVLVKEINPKVKEILSYMTCGDDQLEEAIGALEEVRDALALVVSSSEEETNYEEEDVPHAN